MIHLVEFQTPSGPSFINLSAVQAVQPHGPFAVAPAEEPRCFVSLRNGAVIMVNGTVEDTVKHLAWVVQQLERPARLLEARYGVEAGVAVEDEAPPPPRRTLYQEHRASIAAAQAEVSARHERT